MLPDNYFPTGSTSGWRSSAPKARLYIQETYPSLQVVDTKGSYTPDPTYWPEIRPGVRGGALAEELNYFLNCVINGTPPTVITPEESMAAVVACLAAEKSAATGQVVKVAEML